MALRIDNEDIWIWHERIEEFHSQDLPPKRFCDENKYCYKTFNNRYARIVYKSRKHPDLYQKLIPITRKYMESNIPPSQFIKTHEISIKLLSEMTTHLHYLDAIEEMKGIKGMKPMHFIQVPAVQNRIPVTQEPPIEPEVMKKQNDVELIISKGVKVVVAPEVGADKLVRIIELLKDL